MSGATPKSQAKEPIHIDVLLICQKREEDIRQKLDSIGVLDAAFARAREKAKRLQDIGMKLSANDRRVLLIGQFLATASPGRSAVERTSLVKTALPQLDTSATNLLEIEPAALAGTPAKKKEDQLLLWQR